MRILVLPHTMEIGGSQSNAIELAAAVRDRGHEVVVCAPQGPLVARLDDLGIAYVERRTGRSTPSPTAARFLRDLAVQGGFDVIHGYEWPPILEAEAATWGTHGRTVAVGTVMSMGVAPFLPSSLPLVVGTAEIRADAAATRRGPTELIEPPIDTRDNAPGLDGPALEVPGSVRLDPDALLLVTVCRLVRELKLEGILSTVRAVDRLAHDHRVQYLLVGDGRERDLIRAEAEAVNERHGRQVVVMAGEWLDPRWAYAAADICIGMGGSALRALAFGRPLVVQGEGGYFRLLDEQSVEEFLHQGWYGLDELGEDRAVDRLVEELTPLIDDAQRRAELGDLGRRLVVDRFSLEAAAAVQEKIYADAVRTPVATSRRLLDGAVSGAGLVTHKLRRKWQGYRGTRATDDFNARSR